MFFSIFAQLYLRLKARGVDFNEGNLVKRVEKILPILIPLIVSAMKRSEDLALAMDARCYHGGDGRTRMKPLVYSGKDRAAYAVLLCFAAACVMCRVVM